MAYEKQTIRRLFERPSTDARAFDDTASLPAVSFDPASLKIDDQTIRYIARAREDYADLRHCAAQLASLLLLASLGGARSLADHSMLSAAQENLVRSRCDILGETPPPCAAAHRDHLRRAAALLSAVALQARERRLDDCDIDRLLAILKEAWGEMHRAALALPGFQVVSFGQSCCAVHASANQQRFQAS